MSAPKKDRIIDMRPHKAGKWRIKYVLNGQLRYEYRPTEASAKKRYDVVATIIAAGGDPPDDSAPTTAPGIDGTRAGHWLKIIWYATARVLKNRNDEEARRQLKAISGAAIAAHKFIDMSGLEREAAELRDLVTEIMGARRDGTSLSGTGHSRAAPPSPESTGPEQPIH